VVHGRGRFIAPDTLEVEGERIYARFFCIATGSHSATPSIEGLDSVPYHTSETIFDLRELPQRLLVVGGGYIGTELAQAFARLGSSVTIAEEQPHLLPGQDPELTDLLAYSLRDEGLAVHTNTKVVQVSQRREIYAATLQTGDHEQDLEWDTLLVATGRRPNVAGLGLEVAGVAYDVEKGVHVDTALRTTNPRIYACGDVNGHYPFTQGAAYEAFLVLRNALFPFHSKTDYTLSPWSTFTDPGLARVGLTEAEARERYGNRINVYRYPFADADRAVVEQTTRGMVKLICAPWSGRIVGAHILGPAADELIHEWILAMKHGISASALAGTLHVYPTLSLASRSAAQQPLDALLRSSFSKAALRGYFTLARAVHTRIRPLLSSAKP
jgi:pyruvate/2-oxoglutarate dehydrogenase complex dihydrolipoamide dehydrogenase (E3) component